MHYQFPVIEKLDDVLPALEGCDDFIVAEKDGYTVVNYVCASNQTFPPVTDSLSAIRRECRGIIFDSETGRVLARRLHKFFNLGEREETLPENIDFNLPHIVLDKLDGSMITPIPTKYGIRWGTKMGVTDTSMQVEEFVAKNPEYTRFAEQLFACGLTPIFEWCSRQNRIVIDHPEDQLILVAIRGTKSGLYTPHWLVEQVPNYWSIPVVQAYTADQLSPELVTKLAASEGIEGVVVRFYDGHMVKIKCEWYVRIHKAKEFITNERLTLETWLDEKMDDVIPFLLEDDRKRITEFIDKVTSDIDMAVMFTTKYINDIKASGMSRKEFALRIMPSIVRPMVKAIIFHYWDEPLPLTSQMVRDRVIVALRKSLSSNESYFKMKEQLFPDAVV